MKRMRELDRLFTGVGLADDLELRIEGQEHPEALPNHAVVVGDQQPDRPRRSFFARLRPDHSASRVGLPRVSCSTIAERSGPAAIQFPPNGGCEVPHRYRPAMLPRSGALSRTGRENQW